MAACSSSTPKEWLSLPCDLSLNDSFADDLIRQFDKKRTGLHRELGQEVPSPPPSLRSAPTPPPKPSPPPPEPSTSKAAPPRRSSDLFRRSSAFFKATWAKPSPKKTMDPPPPQIPATLAINTTITLPLSKKSSANSFPSLPPPVISQYPPKPLQYAPMDEPPRRTLMHRLSMPALRRTTTDENGQVSHHRRKSEGPLFRKKKSSQPSVHQSSS